MPDYRVNLEIYNGPLDLLLYLIRREEVDIYDIPISRITQQYVSYVEVLQQLDPNLAGDFLVLAATLMEIKTRTLLPTPPPEEAAADSLEIDPRAELVRQLLEYKAFTDAAADLRGAAEAQAMRFGRRPGLPEGAGADGVDIEDVRVWDLLDAFSKLMASIGKGAATHQVIYDDTPIELHAEDILDRLRREGSMTFRRIFEGRTGRTQILGLFLALLELVRLKKVLAHQDANFGEIHVHLNPTLPSDPQAEPPPADDDGESPAGPPDAAPAAGAALAYLNASGNDYGNRADPTVPAAAEPAEPLDGDRGTGEGKLDSEDLERNMDDQEDEIVDGKDRDPDEDLDEDEDEDLDEDDEEDEEDLDEDWDDEEDEDLDEDEDLEEEEEEEEEEDLDDESGK